jgi:hypothetical protein
MRDQMSNVKIIATIASTVAYTTGLNPRFSGVQQAKELERGTVLFHPYYRKKNDISEANLIDMRTYLAAVSMHNRVCAATI